MIFPQISYFEYRKARASRRPSPTPTVSTDDQKELKQQEQPYALSEKYYFRKVSNFFFRIDQNNFHETQILG